MKVFEQVGAIIGSGQRDQALLFFADASVYGLKNDAQLLGYGTTLNPNEAAVIIVPNNDVEWCKLSVKYDRPIAWVEETREFRPQRPPSPGEEMQEVGLRFLKGLGQAKRSGTADTPERFAKAWEFWTSGYNADVSDVLTTFKDGADGCDEMVVVKGIWFYSHCEHHLAPFFGTVSIGYLPQDKIVGLSKLARITDIFARRLQVQERMTTQIATALMEHLSPLGCGVRVTARHLCMESRGIQKPGCETVTSSLQGKFRDDPTVRAEFLELVR